MFHLAVLMHIILLPAVLSAEWPQFRGPNAQGVVKGAEGVPLQMVKENMVWETRIPGKGWSSPVLSNGLIVVTTAVQGETLELRAMAFDEKSGELAWDQKVFEPNQKELDAIHQKNSYASSSPLIVDEVVFVHFGHMGTAALELKSGKVKWRYHQTYAAKHGNGGSPVWVDGVLIFSADGEDSGLLRGLDAKTGKLKWEVDRKMDVRQKFSFGTPLVVKEGGRTVVVSQGSGMVGGYLPENGKLLWLVRYGQGFSLVPRPVFFDGRVYVTTGFGKAKLLSIRLKDARGDVTDIHVEWTVKKDVPTTPSFVVTEGEIFITDDTGRLSCLDRITGKRLWRDSYKRKISASLTLVGDRLYAFSEEGQAFVHQVSREGVTKLATSDLKEPVFASPAIVEGGIIVRSAKFLRKFGKR